MTWNRTVFVGDSLTNSNNGVISVEIIDSANKINFVISENALSYNLYGRILDTTNWTLIETIQSGDAMPGSSFFTDDFSWIQDQNIVNIEYKVEVEKNSPQITEGHYISEFEGSSGGGDDDDDDGGGGDGEVEPVLFIPDHRPFFAISLSVEQADDPDITVNGLMRSCDPDGAISIVGANEFDHWKMNKAPYDGRNDNFLAPFCPEKPWLEHGYSINRKSNPDTINPEDDFILHLVHTHPDKPGRLEDAYRRGYRRFMLRGVFGMRTRATNGSAVPSAIWSAGDPNLGTWNDKPSIGTNPSTGFEYPFTSNGNLVSMDSSATKGDAQQSVINFLKPWIQSKEDLGDPVDVYIYGGYQPAFYGNGDPARGNLSMTFFVGDSAWKENRTNPNSGVSWRDHFPLPDMSNPDHIDYFDAEYLPWIDVGAKGFIIDGASNGGELPDGSGVPVNGASPPIDRIPGVFPYFREHLGVDVLGEAVPLAQFGENAAMNEDLYRETGFMAYSNGTYWGDMWRNINLDPSDSEIHIFLIWAFNGGSGGFNSAYSTRVDGVVVYDIEGMKAEIDEMWARGFVVSCNIGLYSSTSPPNEAPARQEIIEYVLQGPNG
jgi:hypothetical protein